MATERRKNGNPASNSSRKSKSPSPKKKGSDLFVACDFSDEVNKLSISDYIYIYCWLGWFTAVPVLIGMLGVSFKYRTEITHWPFLILFTPMVISYIYPIEERLHPPWGIALGKRIMHTAKRYFGLKLCYVDKRAVENSGPGIFLIEPHDVMPLSLFCFSDFLGFNKGHKNRGCLSGACFVVPLMRHVYSWASATSVSKKSILKLMDAGISPTICPGGVQEVTLMKNGAKECILFLKKRQGSIRLAMEYGRPIIPTFTFGQRGTWSFTVLRSKIGNWIGRKIGFAPMIFFGIGGIPFAIPNPTPLTVVVGKPIEVPKFVKKEGKFDQRDVDKYHQKVINGFAEVFENHKRQFGMGDITLKIE